VKIVIKAFFIACSWTLVAIACDCGAGPGLYKITDLGIMETEGVLVYRPSENDSILNFDVSKELIEHDTIRYKLVGFRFTTTSQSISANATVGIFPSLYACDHPLLTPTQTFTDLKITSSNEFVADATSFAAGESLNNIFALNELGKRATIIGDAAYANFPIYFILNAAPKNIQLHQFTFKATLNDGSMFTTTTEPLYFKP
jgi:hypothetical protein